MQFYLAEGNMIFSLISRNIAGQTKKSTALAMTFIAWAAGNMTAPQVRVFHGYSPTNISLRNFYLFSMYL